MTFTANEHKSASLLRPTQKAQQHNGKYTFVMVDGGESCFVSKAKRRKETMDSFFFPVKRRCSLNRFEFHASAVFLLAKILIMTVKYRCHGRHNLAEQLNKNCPHPPETRSKNKTWISFSGSDTQSTGLLYGK